MASVFCKQRDYKDMATKYSTHNDFQLKFGKELVSLLDIKPGEKVLDMGCGTGELTTYIAAQVGEEGRVVGVDPDKNRIKVATQKYDGRALNLDFVTGDSSSKFPYFNEEYYDVHFSNQVFHWLTSQEKAEFMKTAMKCLKPGGRIAILCAEKPLSSVDELLTQDQIENGEGSPDKAISKVMAESILQDSGFLIQCSEFSKCAYTFPSVDYYVTWYCASLYIDESIILPEKRQYFAKKYAGLDTTMRLNGYIYQIIAKKSSYSEYGK